MNSDISTQVQVDPITGEVLKKPIRTNSDAYYDFIEGEESIEEMEDPISKFRERLVKLARQRFGSYKYNFPEPPYNDKASKALLSISNDILVRAEHVADLLEHGADPNYCDGSKYNETPIFGLIRSSNVLAVKMIVLAGARVSYLDDVCRTPLMYACDTKQHGERVDLVRYLLTLPSVLKSIETRDSGGNSALLNAIFNSNIWIVRELLLAGASVLYKGVGRIADTTGSSAYETAKWIYMVGIGIDPSVKLLPLSLEFPNSFLYRKFSLKARYDYAILLRIQSMWTYSAELVFRMVVRKKCDEERLPQALARSYIGNSTQEMDAEFPSTEEEFNRELAQSRKNKKSTKVQGMRDIQQRKELEKWNQQRMTIARRIDQEYTESMQGHQSKSMVDWVKQKIQLPVPPTTKKSRNQSRRRGRPASTAVSFRDDADRKTPSTAQINADNNNHHGKSSLPSAFAPGSSIPDPMVAPEPAQDDASSIQTWVASPKKRGIYAPVPVKMPKTEVPLLQLAASEDDSKDADDDFKIFKESISRHPVGQDDDIDIMDDSGSSLSTATNKGWKSATLPSKTKMVLDGVWTPGFSIATTFASQVASITQDTSRASASGVNTALQLHAGEQTQDVFIVANNTTADAANRTLGVFAHSQSQKDTHVKTAHPSPKHRKAKTVEFDVPESD